MAVEDVVVFLKANISEYSSKMKTAAAETESLGKKGAGHFSQLGAVGKAALLGIAGGAVAVGVTSIKMADDFETSHARLVTALKNSGTSWGAQSKAIEAADKAGARFGYNKAQIEDALATMTRGMGSATKATHWLGLAQDIAAAKGIPLADAALAVTKASEGQLRPLKQLGIDLPIAAGGALKTQTAFVKLGKAQGEFQAVQDKIHAGLLKGPAAHAALEKALLKVRDAQDKFNSLSHAGGDILDGVAKKMHGSAAASADTFGGKVKALHAMMENLQVTVGLKLIPVITNLAGKIQGAVEWFGKHQLIAKALAITVGVILVAAIGAYIVGMIAAAVATLAAVWPILAVIAAVAALVVGILYLKDHWSEVWDAIKNAVHVAWDAIVGFFKSIPGRLVAALSAVGSLLVDVFGKALKFLVSHLPKLALGAALFFILWPLILTAMLVKLGILLVQRFGAGFVHLVSQLPGLALRLYIWWQLLPVHIAEKLLPLGIMLIGKMGSAFVQLVKALPGAAVALFKWWTGLPKRIFDAIGDLGGAFYKFGKNLIQSAIDGIKSMAGGLGGAFHGILKGVPGADLLSHLPGVGGLFSGDVGGWIPGGAGHPLLMLGHGGEYIMSRNELAGRPRSDSPVGRGGGGDIHLTINGANMSASDVMREAHWAQKTRVRRY